MRLGFDLSGKRVLVVGLARTGVVTSLFSAGYGATVTATDERPETELAETAAQLRAAGVKLELGGHVAASFLEQDLIVVSPGVPANLPPLELARARGIPVWSEIELAWRFLRGKLVAITGSNGKTTTTALLAHILQTLEHTDAGRRKYRRAAARAGGMIHRPIRHGRGNQQLSAGDDRQIPAGNRRAAESHAGSSRPPRHVRRIRARQDAHVRKSTGARRRRAERGRSRNHQAHAREAAHFLVQPPEARRRRRVPARRRNHFPQ